MKKKQFKKTLFNKNHITITHETCEGSCRNYCQVKSSTTLSSVTHWWENKDVVERKISPLGFYYDKVTSKKDRYLENKLTEITVSFMNGEAYKIVYYTAYNSSNIGVDVRPWEIADEKSMHEHFIHDLKGVVDSILAKIKSEKRITIYMGNVNHDFVWLKNMLYTELFGDKNGIRFQTDSEKILSHGFDLKTSFRKDKEK